MSKILTWLFFFSILTDQLRAQILPKEGSKLNYRLVGFSFPERQSKDKYTVQIATGDYTDEGSFRKNIIKSSPCDKNKEIIEVPAFGKRYTWRVVYSNANSGKTNGELHHFRTGINSCVDTSIIRLRILKNTEQYKDDYVFMDGSKALYDMNGKPVWFLPMADEKAADKIWGFGDLKYTKQGTVTYITTPKGGQVFEADFNGTVLWSGPNSGKVSGDTIEYYNHEFMRLPNGHYMALGGEYVHWQLPSAPDTGFIRTHYPSGKITKDSNNNYYQKLHFGTLIEYDHDGNVVWSWKSSQYFRSSDVYNHTNIHGTFDIDDVHSNAFYFDEKSKAVYIAFRDISRIIKIEYPEKEVLAAYGKKYQPGSPGYDNSMFYHQHSCRLSQDGYLYLYNNNNRFKGALPTLVMMQAPASEKDTLKKIWEYQCTTEGMDTSIKEVQEFSALGSIIELPDRALLASMTSNKYTRTFIIDRNKKIQWNAMLERWNPNTHKWYSVIQYRANIITDHGDLERLIWNAETAARGAQ